MTKKTNVKQLYDLLREKREKVAETYHLDASNLLDKALIEHYLLADLDGLEKLARAGFRLNLWEMTKTNNWSNVKIPVIDPLTNQQMVDGQTGELVCRTFSGYDQWFDSVTAQKSDSTVSELRNCVKFLFPAVENGSIKNPATGRPYKIEDMLFITSRNLAVLARKVRELAEGGRDVSVIGKHVEAAQNGSREELIEGLSGDNLHGGNIDTIKAYRVFADDGTTQKVVMELTPIQAKLLETALGNRMEWNSTTLSELIDLLQGDRHESGNPQGDTGSERTFDQWLRTKA